MKKKQLTIGDVEAAVGERLAETGVRIVWPSNIVEIALLRFAMGDIFATREIKGGHTVGLFFPENTHWEDVKAAIGIPTNKKGGQNAKG